MKTTLLLASALCILALAPTVTANEVCKQCVTNPDNMLPELNLPTDTVAVMPGDNVNVELNLPTDVVSVMPGDNVAVMPGDNVKLKR